MRGAALVPADLRRFLLFSGPVREPWTKSQLCFGELGAGIAKMLGLRLSAGLSFRFFGRGGYHGFIGELRRGRFGFAFYFLILGSGSGWFLCGSLWGSCFGLFLLIGAFSGGIPVMVAITLWVPADAVFGDEAK